MLIVKISGCVNTMRRAVNKILTRYLLLITDVNECLLPTNPCQIGQRCINNIGSYQCLREIGCGTGYELTENNQCRGM